MAGPITKEYISTASKSFISNDINGKMIKKNFIEIEGTFLLKVRDNTFYGNDGENVFKLINSFLNVVEPLKIRGLSHGRFRLSVFPISLSGVASEWFTKECIGTISTWDDLVKRFVLKFYNLYDHEETEDENDPDMIDNVPEIFKINDDLFKVRRFEMLEYSFTDDEEYIIIKESEYLNHSMDSLDAYQELLVIKESLVKTKQKGAILELKQRHLKNIIFCYYTPYPAMKIRRISVGSAQETRNDQFPIRRITLHQYAVCTAGRLRKKYRLSLKNDMSPRN
nr:hypothetical protein [Tanacetum cinerariifolium]